MIDDRLYIYIVYIEMWIYYIYRLYIYTTYTVCTYKHIYKIIEVSRYGWTEMRMKWLCLHSCGAGLAASGWRMWTKAMSRMRICACYVDEFGISKFFSSKLWETSWLLSKFFVELHPSEHSPGAPAPTPQPAPAPAPAPPAPGGLLDLDLDFTVRRGSGEVGSTLQGTARTARLFPPKWEKENHHRLKKAESKRRYVIVPRKVLYVISLSYLKFIFTKGNPLCRL